MKRVTQVTSFHLMNSCCGLRPGANCRGFTKPQADCERLWATRKDSRGCISQLRTPKKIGLRHNTQGPGDAAGCRSYLLWVVGHVRQHGGHVEHDLVALVAGVQGVGARRVRWRKTF